VKRLLALLSFAAVLGGCTTTTIDRPVTVTTKLLPEVAKADTENKGKEVTGESCSRIVLSLIPVGIATAEKAYADALEKAPGTDALVRYEARVTTLYVFLFYTEVCSQVHGYAVSSKTLAP
jgi:hypothetical protein